MRVFSEFAPVQIGSVKVGPGQPLVLIAGPDVIEGEAHLLRHAERIAALCAQAGVQYIVKSSYDKANRTSGSSFRGPGMREGLRILKKIKDTLHLPVLSDVHETTQVDEAAQVLDVIQIPAFLSRQTDLVVMAAKTGRPLNIKKGQFLAPWDMKNVIEKARAVGNHSILACDRGTTFGYNNLVSDMRGLQVMAGFGVPVIFDGTHSVQLPGGQGESSGGQREFVPTLVRAAVATGYCHGVFLEVHENPAEAPCDGPNMLPLSELPELLRQMQAIVRAL
jgi:2-dehydro-3-deoxyphosphooctonate aldolase (KDO 8-P synthase)